MKSLFSYFSLFAAVVIMGSIIIFALLSPARCPEPPPILVRSTPAIFSTPTLVPTPDLTPPVFISSLAIVSSNSVSRLIIFHTSPEIARQFDVYDVSGVVDQAYEIPSEFWMVVDGRYDFEQVLAYMRNFEEVK